MKVKKNGKKKEPWSGALQRRNDQRFGSQK